MLTIRDALQVPIKMITPQGYKIPLPMPTNLEPTTNKLLSILDNRLLLMEEDNQLVVIDALKLKNAILQYSLTTNSQIIYELPQAITVKYCLGLDIAQLNTNTVVIRTIPRILQDLNLSVDYEKLFNISKATNLIDALCLSSHVNKSSDILTWLRLALELQIPVDIFKKSYSSEQLIKILS
jgi:hypothetical protein